MRAIVSVATHWHVYKFDRLVRLLLRYEPTARMHFWRNKLPGGSPTHAVTPYAFKAFAIADAVKKGASTVLWLDSSIVPLKPLLPLWTLIEDQGYWFSRNPPHNCGQWTCDSALGPLRITREEAFGIPQVIGTAFGLNFRHELAQQFFEEFIKHAKTGAAFRGPWDNSGGCASADPRVLGHRHDQTVSSVLAHRLGMRLTEPPRWIADTPSDETLLAIVRSWTRNK